MPRAVDLIATEYPDDFQTISMRFDANTTDGSVIFIADRDMVIDSIATRWLTAASAASSSSGGGSPTLTVVKAASGTAFTSGTAITAALDLTQSANVTRYMAEAISGQGLSGIRIARGEAVIFDFSATPTGLAGACATFRVRSRFQ